MQYYAAPHHQSKDRFNIENLQFWRMSFFKTLSQKIPRKRYPVRKPNFSFTDSELSTFDMRKSHMISWTHPDFFCIRRFRLETIQSYHVLIT